MWTRSIPSGYHLEMVRAILASMMLVAATGANAAALQLREAWHNGASLPSSSGQITTEAECKEIVAHNLSIAPTFGYAVNVQAGTFTDRASGITIRQSCVPAEPWSDNPMR